jgi:manganese transport protein
MGDFVNKPLTKIFGWTIASAIICLNAILLYLTFSGKV